MSEKNQMIKSYITQVASRVNEQYQGLIDDDKINKAMSMFSDSTEEYDTIVQRINELVNQVIQNYLKEQEKRFDPKLVKENHEKIYSKLEVLIRKLNEKGIDYQLAGALCAYIKYGVESNRTHDDIDINLNEADINKFKEVCEEMGFQFHDNRLTTPRILKNGIPSGEHEVIAILDGSDFHIGAFCFERKPDGTVINKGYYHDENGQIFSRNDIMSPQLASEIFGREQAIFRGQKLFITPPEYIYKLKSYTHNSKDRVDLLFMESRIDRDKLARINELSKDSRIEHNKVDISIQLTPELQTIFASIVRDSQYSSSELLKKYSEIPEFHEFSEQLKSRWSQLLQQISDERKKYPEMSDSDFFKSQVLEQSIQIIEGIKKDYAGLLTPEILDRLNKFNLEVKYDPEFEHDMTAYADKNMISINTAYFAKGKSLEEQIVQAMGTMPHEIFHFVFNMLKSEQLADERMVFELTNGDVASSFGMVGHILNEGFVEKLSADFCKRNGIFYTISPSYIQFVNLCDYIMQHNHQVTETFLMKHNYEDVLRLCSPEVVEAYKQTERTEYANNFKLKLKDGSYREIKPEEIVRSFNQYVKKDEEYSKRKKQIINNFINSTVMDFANKIYSTYPYSLEYSNVSSYKEYFKSIFQIPAYHLSEEEWNKIIDQINEKLGKFVDALIKDDEIRQANQQQTQDISLEIEELYDDDLSMMIADEIKWDIIFDLQEKYNQGLSFVAITADDLTTKYNINDRVAQKLAAEINMMVKNYINEKEKSRKNYQSYILDGFDEENKGMNR